MNKRLILVSLAISAMFGISALADELIVVKNGKALQARYEGSPWQSSAKGLSSEGTGKFLYATRVPGQGDFNISARLKLAHLEGTAASFVINGSHIGFDGRGGNLFSEGPLFGDKTSSIGKSDALLNPDKLFTFEVIREQGTTRFLKDNKEILRKEGWNGPISNSIWRKISNQTYQKNE
jgi:hypothetical protein